MKIKSIVCSGISNSTCLQWALQYMTETKRHEWTVLTSIYDEPSRFSAAVTSPSRLFFFSSFVSFRQIKNPISILFSSRPPAWLAPSIQPTNHLGGKQTPAGLGV